MLQSADVCHNFLYKRPAAPLELGLAYFIASELSTARFLHRQFVWHENVLWLEDIPLRLLRRRAVLVVGGECDGIANMPSIAAYMRGGGGGGRA